MYSPTDHQSISISEGSEVGEKRRRKAWEFGDYNYGPSSPKPVVPASPKYLPSSPYKGPPPPNFVPASNNTINNVPNTTTTNTTNSSYNYSMPFNPQYYQPQPQPPPPKLARSNASFNNNDPRDYRDRPQRESRDYRDHQRENRYHTKGGGDFNTRIEALVQRCDQLEKECRLLTTQNQTLQQLVNRSC